MAETMRLEDLLDKLWFSSTTTVEKGSAFERLMASYLRTAPEFADRFEEVYLWQEWPERNGQHDHGIDIVAKDIVTGGWCAVQCKFYDPQHHVSKADVDSFLAASSKKGFTSRVIVSTAKDWGPTVEKQLDNLSVPVVRIGLSDLMDSKVDWSQFDPRHSLVIPDVLPTTGKKTLLPHQREARSKVRDGLVTNDRGQLVMACGTGKTFTSLKIAEDLATGRKAEPTTVLFLVPSIQLLNQTLREWKQESQIPFRAYAVCSDVQVGKGNSSEDLSVHDLIYPATTDTEVLAREIRKRTEDDQFTVVFSTYQSIAVVAEAQKRGLPQFDLIICDEAHRTTGVTLADQDESHFVRVHDNSFIKGTKRLYMTATPRLFDPNTKEKAEKNDAVLASMDDENVFGPVFHRLGFGEAVERDLLTDYKVLVLTIDEEFVAANFQEEMASAGELKLGDAAKLIGCWNGLAKRFGKELPEGVTEADLTPMRRAVAFAASIKASKVATDVFPNIVDRLRSTRSAEGDESAEAAPGNTLAVESRHVDGTMNAMERGALLQWLKEGSRADADVCRVLTNARCLSEGVDVPALDAVMFLTPRGSQVDIVQSVGRVMRKDPSGEKKMGYIILPVVVPSGMSPEEALRDNERFKVVWQVLQALRAHDDRFNAMVNKIDLNKKDPDKIVIIDVNDPADRKTTDPTQLSLPFGIDAWRDAIYARIVQKVGERRYWETWAKDVAEIAQQHISRIHGLLADRDSVAAKEFNGFLEGLRGNLNDGITRDDAVEMLAQHLITRPVFDALFSGYDFASSNPVAQTMEEMLAVLDEHSLDSENSSLQKFYDSVRSRVEGVDNAEGRQRIIIELYDKFFATAFKKTVEKLGIVYTPVEIVDFILNSADQVLREHFGQGVSDQGVHILDGFTGTGTFIVRLLQSGLIKPEDLARKYANELHANEILLLAYYIAAVNIETTYQDLVRGSLDEEAEYKPFPGLILTDTFQSWEHDDTPDLAVFPENNERLERLKGLDITVIVGNPPYSSGQDSANDNNQNEKYPHLDAAIRDTYAARSTATNKNSLYDSYIRAIKWATLRIKDRGVIAFVTNGGFLDSNTADGMRKTLAEEFSAIHVYNLRGNARTAGEQRKKEGGTVFDTGSRATVAITVLVKDPSKGSPATIHYTDIGDYLSREEKLRKIGETGGVAGLETVTLITPNAHGDWLVQRREDFASFMPLENSVSEPGVFEVVGPGLQTNRDAWIYNFDPSRLEASMRLAANTYAHDRALGRSPRTSDPTLIKWSSSLVARLARDESLPYRGDRLQRATYRPFQRTWAHVDLPWIHRPGVAPKAFPPGLPNRVLAVMAPRLEADPAVLVSDTVPDLSLYTYTATVLPRWWYQAIDLEGELDPRVGEFERSGYRRTDNVTDEVIRRFCAAYGEAVSRDDVFDYVYGMLHSTEYRQTYAADLKKMLPRIPLVEDAQPFIDAGRALSELHLGYESVTPYPLDGLDVEAPASLGLGGDSAAYDFFRVEKMRFGKPTAQQKKDGLKNNRTTIVYNNRITLSGIPEAAYRYMLGSRSAIEWIMDRYQVKTDKASGIVNDPNDWSREVSDPMYIIDLLARIVTVSLETMQIVDSLPALAIRENQNPGA